MIKFFKWLIGIILIVICLLLGLLYIGGFHPRKVKHVTVYSPDHLPSLQSGQQLKIMTWNVQYMAGTKQTFWYEGGSALQPSKEEIESTTEEVAKLITLEEPDIILLQEVDDGASRTYQQDQLKELLMLLPAPYQNHCSAFYWKSFFVPHPQIKGSVGMKLSVISKYKINGAIRHQLALIDHNVQNWYDPFIFWFERQFHLKRAILEVSFPLDSGGNFTIFNTHLTAYPGGESSVLEKQVAQIEELLKQKDIAGIPWVIGGDFNLLPPGIAANQLELTEGEFYAQKTEITKLYEKYQGVPDFAELDTKEVDNWYTYTPNKASNHQADRTLDYFFMSKNIDLNGAFVIQQNTQHISDHFPLTIYVKLPTYE